MKETKAAYLYGKLSNLSAALVNAGLAGGQVTASVNAWIQVVGKHLSLDTWSDLTEALSSETLISANSNDLSDRLQWFNKQYLIAIEAQRTI